MSKALVVLSGGQDSVTCLAIAKYKMAFKEIHCLTFDYGQRHQRELDAAFQIAKLVGVDSHEVCQIGPILAGTSPLTNHKQELEQYADHESMSQIIGSRIEKTFVPMRNALFLTLAANRAAVLGADVIITGVCEADGANYPDCTSDFIDSQEETLNHALGAMDETGDQRGALGVHILTPLMHLSKANSVLQMRSMGADIFTLLAFSHTAYDGQYPPTGKDHATVLRAHGFEAAGQPDPLWLRAYMEGHGMPETSNYSDLSAKELGILTGAIERHQKTIESWGAQPIELFLTEAEYRAAPAATLAAASKVTVDGVVLKDRNNKSWSA